jgi:hypothetical protein
VGNGFLFTAGVAFLAVDLIRTGHVFVAAFTLTPAAAMLVAFAFSHTELGRSILTTHVAGPLPDQEESRSRFLFRVALWWAIAALSLPIAILGLDISARHSNYLGDFEGVLAVPLPIFGVACSIMSIQSVVRGIIACRQVRPGIDPEPNRQEAWRVTVAASKQGTSLYEAEIEGLGFLKAGQKVIHPKFGRGEIASFYVFPDGTTTVWVNFGSHGRKALLPKYAALRIED